LLEAYVDLANLTTDSAYDEFLHAAYLDQQRRLLRIAKQQGSTHRFLRELQADSRDAALGRIESELLRLRAKGVTPLQVRERFKRAGRLDLYEVPYSFMAQQSHNNLGALQDRHVELAAEEFHVYYFRDVKDDQAQMVIDTTGGVLAHSLALIRSVVGDEGVQMPEPVTKGLEELRSLWTKV
jgi:hypothetical protein